MSTKLLVDALFESCKKGDLPANSLTPETIAAVRDHEENSLIDVAIMSKHEKLSCDLIIHAGVALSDTTLNLALRSAVKSRQFQLLKDLYRLTDVIYHEMHDAATYKQYRHDMGSLALSEACKQGLEDYVRFLLQNNTYLAPNIGLLDAWVHGHLHVVDMLIAVGATAHHDSTGKFAVEVMTRSHKLLGNLIDNDTRTDAINYLAVQRAGAPVEAEAEDEDADSVEYYFNIGKYGTKQLLDHFFRVKERHEARHIRYAMSGAAFGDNMGTLQLLMAEAYSHHFPVEAQTLFDHAIRHGSGSVAECLFTTYKINLNHRCRFVDGRDCRLGYAAECGNINLISTILRFPGQDVNCVAKLKWPHVSNACTALSRASDPSVIRFLLRAKADVNPEGCDTVLRGACEKLRPDAVKALLAAGAEVNRGAGYEGAKSALHCAMLAECTNDRVHDKVEVITMLLDAGADTRDCGGGKSLLELGWLPDSSFYHLDTAFAVALARDPGLVHCRNASGATPLLYVLYKYKDPALVKVLLDAKADVNAVDADGNTALSQLVTVDDSVSFADIMSTRRIFRQLVVAGLDITQCVEGKDTALIRLMGPEKIGYTSRSLCVERGPTASRGILDDILDAILYRPVADGNSAMTVCGEAIKG